MVIANAAAVTWRQDAPKTGNRDNLDAQTGRPPQFRGWVGAAWGCRPCSARHPAAGGRLCSDV